MTLPKLDERTVADILAEIKKKSEFYTPEWRADFDDPDAGAALARLFAEMFYDTIDRYNRFPEKCYIEFLNMIGVCAKNVAPAVGMAGARLVEGAQDSVFIRAGTQLFTDISGEQGDRRVVFETDAGFFATPAKLRGVFMTDPLNDIITRTDPEAEGALPLELFHPKKANSIERHVFALASEPVLYSCSPCEITVRLENTGLSYRSEAAVKKLCSAQFARWSVLTESGRVYLEAKSSGGGIVLTKTERAQVLLTNERGEPVEEGAAPWLFCEMTADGELDEITADSLSVSARSVTDGQTSRRIAPSHIFANDTEVSLSSGGYCFGREPSVYDSFFVECTEAFCKRGAQITAEFTVGTVTVGGDEEDEAAVDFDSRLLVDKADAAAKPLDDIRISDVVWEYWNGYGWALLEVSGDVNPFSCQGEGVKRVVSFCCPADMARSVQNAYDGLWIRARVRGIDNRFSMRGRWHLPYFKSMDISYDYGGKFLPVDAVFSENSRKRLMYTPHGAEMNMTLFRVFPEKHHAVYFCFDGEPSGYPVNLFAEFAGSTDEERVIVFEYLAGERGGAPRWNEFKVIDRTQGFESSGLISLYTPKGFAEAELFGERGCWIRAVNRSMKFHPDCRRYPRLSGIRMNTVGITQKQSISGEPHVIAAGSPERAVVLREKPVLQCAVWVNELGETPLSELNELAARDSSLVRRVCGAAGELTEFWVKWEQRLTFADSGESDRHYTLDAAQGAIRFGDGVNGRIPSYGADAAISVDYAFGGGREGNLPAGTIEGAIVSLPYVESITNIGPTCGGSSEQSLETVKRIGTKRLRHFGRAVTCGDYENLILEEFCEVSEVRCFAGRDRTGALRSGYVTVVVLPHDGSEGAYAASLCRRIEAFVSARAGCELVSAKRLAVIPAVTMRVSSEITVQLDDYEYAAEAERSVTQAVKTLLEGSGGARIGSVPRRSDFLAALGHIPHVAYVSRIVLVGEYYRENEKLTVSLDDAQDYRYLVAASGEHIVKM